LKNLLEVYIFRLLHEPTTHSNLVLLREKDGDRFLPMSIGTFEAEAIARALSGMAFERPLTHDLLKSILEQMGGTLEKVVINDLSDDVFYARLIIRRESGMLSVDARPSDSLCLATLFKCPIFVGTQVMDKAGMDASEFPEAEESEGPPEGYA